MIWASLLKFVRLHELIYEFYAFYEFLQQFTNFIMLYLYQRLREMPEYFDTKNYEKWWLEFLYDFHADFHFRLYILPKAIYQNLQDTRWQTGAIMYKNFIEFFCRYGSTLAHVKNRDLHECWILHGDYRHGVAKFLGAAWIRIHSEIFHCSERYLIRTKSGIPCLYYALGWLTHRRLCCCGCGHPLRRIFLKYIDFLKLGRCNKKN